MIKRASPACAGLLLLALVGAGCAHTNVPSLSEAAIEEPEEPMLLSQAATEEFQLEHSGFVVSLPETEAYLLQIAQTLAGADTALAQSLRVRIVQDPTLNAFALPNGALFVHTGLLARLENEAQIATILAHEMSHVEERHALKRYRQTKSNLAWMNVLTVSTGGYGSLLGGLGALASVSGYSRDLERDADVHGFLRLREAGYDLHSTVQVFDLLQRESERSSRKEPFFFGSHPRIAERQVSFGNLLVQYGVPETPGRLGETDYVRHLPPLLRLDIAAGLRIGDQEGAAQQLNRLKALAPYHVETAYLEAEWHRKGGAAGAATEAIPLYRRAITLDASYAPAWRGLGLTLGSVGDTREASMALRRYLDLSPVANDRAHMLQLISTWNSPAS